MGEYEACCDRDGDGVRIRVRVTPRARRSGIVGLRGDSVKIRLSAPPVDDKANRALRETLAEALAVRSGALSLVSGQRARDKVVRVAGIDVPTVAARLAQAAGRSST